MSFEVEVKYRVRGHTEIAARLASEGFLPSAEVELEDAYFENRAGDFVRTKQALRLRRIGNSVRLTYKGPRRRGLIKTREEIELHLGEGREAFEKWLRLFRRLGFRPVTTVCKTRRPYFLQHRGRSVEVALDVAEGLGTFAEIETITDTEADLPRAQSAVLDLAARLGLTEIERRSYRRMAIDRRIRSDKRHATR
jgi:adenylate cyclase class 2